MDEQLAEQVDAAFVEQLSTACRETEDVAGSLMATFLDAGCTYLNGDHKTAQSRLHQYIEATSSPTETMVNLCVVGAMAVAGCLEHAAPDGEADQGDQGDQAVFDLDAAGNELTYAALSLCNAAIDDERDDMADILKSIYGIGGVKGLATMLAALVELFATVLDDLARKQQ